MEKRYEFIKYMIGALMIIAFIVLKLTNTIDWNWWWVAVPIVLFLL